MYKVFFNDSSICLRSKIENSLKDNNQEIIDNEQNNINVNDILKLENTEFVKNLIFINRNIDQLWINFRKLFVEITAAGGIVTNTKGQILAIKRLGVWDLPKGKVEKHESIEEAAIREVEEECGISGVKIIKKLDSTFHIYRSPFHLPPNNLVLKETHWFKMIYKGNKAAIPQKEENIEEVHWMNKNEINIFIENTYPNIAELLNSYFYENTESNLA